jgi:glycosyltransferase involved in cell wall biosynthesis
MTCSTPSPAAAAADAAGRKAKLRVALFGTHPRQFNGYSKVVYELCKAMTRRHADEVKMHVFGFQNFYGANTEHRLDVPPEVEVYDPYADETPKAAGFGPTLVKSYVATCRPDVCVVFNDVSVMSSIINELKDAPNRADFRVVAYIDQVYLCQKKEFVAFLNLHADAAIAFTPEWRDCIVRQGLVLPCHVLAHGINADTYYPVPRVPALARRYFGLPANDFLVLNLNRNQPRKRWDTCIKAFAEVVARLPDAPIKLVIGTEMRGPAASWDLMALYERELAKRGVPLARGLERIVVPGSPQQMTDFDTNVLYNTADVGINTCDGEGFGLCNFEQAAVGIPQVVPRLGGFLHFLDRDCATLVDPKLAIYVESSRDAVGGEAQLSDYADFADAIVAYYKDADLRERHGAEARRRILRDFSWDRIADDFRAILRDVAPASRLRPQQPAEALLPPPAASVAAAASAATVEAAAAAPPISLADAEALLGGEDGTAQQDSGAPPPAPEPPVRAESPPPPALKSCLSQLPLPHSPPACPSPPPAAPAQQPAALNADELEDLRALRRRLDAILGPPSK